MTEADLALKFIDYFEDYEIFKEAHNIDFIARLGPIDIAVEVKLDYNFKVLEQALRNIEKCHYSYIAVPKTKDPWFRNRIAREFGIGVLIYDPKYNKVHEEIPAKILKIRNRLKLEEWMKSEKNVAGSQHQRSTPFKESIENIKRILNRKGGKASLKEIFDQPYHWSSTNGAKIGLKKGIETGYIKGIKIENGFLILNEE